MEPAPGNAGNDGLEYGLDLLKAIPNGTVFAYNLDKSKTPGGMKVRWKVRVAAGPEAARHDARLAEAIREALLWLHQHPHTTSHQ